MALRYILVFFLALSFAGSTLGFVQNEQYNTADTARVNLLNGVAERFIYINTDSTIYYATQALDLANKINFEKGKGDAYTLIAQGNINAGNYSIAEENILDALHIFKRLKLPKQEGEVLNKIGWLRNLRGEYDLAKLAYDSAIVIFKDIGYLLGQAKANSAFGIMNQKKGNYLLASEYLFLSLSQFQQLDDKGGAADALNNLGVVFEGQEEFARALENYNGAYKVYTEVGDKLGEAIGLHNAGIILKKTGHLDSALFNFRKAKKIDLTIGALDGVAYDEKELGDVFLRMNELDSASYYLTHSLVLAEAFKDPVVIVPAIIGLGKIENIKNKYTGAEKYAIKAYEMALSYGLQNEQKEAAELLYQINYNLSNFEKALQYHQIYHSLKDSIFNLQNIKRMAVAEANYEFEKEKVKRDMKQEIENAEKAKTIADALWVRNTSIVGIVVATIFSILILFNYQIKRKANKELVGLNKEIAKQSEELNIKANELVILNRSLNKLNTTLEQKVISRTKKLEENNISLAISNKELEKKNKKLASYAFFNAHKLRAPVASILGLVDLFMKSEVDAHEKEEIIGKIKTSTEDLNAIVREIQALLEEE